jgi:glycosyltransferase involved in cell wall biosynthesis
VKIAWVCHSPRLGGAQLTMVEAAEGLAGKGHQVLAVVPAPGALAERLAGAGAAVSVQPVQPWVSGGSPSPYTYRIRCLRHHVLTTVRLAGLLRRERPDLVVTNTVAAPAGALAARCVRIPHVWYLHELYGKEGHDLFLDFGEKLSLSLIHRLSERVIVNSITVRKQYTRRIPADKVRQVRCAVQVPALTAPPSLGGPLRLIVVGLIAPGKRQEDAIRALHQLAAKGIDADLTLLGSEDPEYVAFLRGLARELSVQERVHFAGFAPHPHEAVAASDLALICSRGEAFGRVTIEAMKLGTPVVGANDAGTAELIRDGWNGRLYRLGDAADLAGKIAALSRDPKLREEMGRNAAAWSNATFTLDQYASDLLQVFEEVLAASQSGGSA